MTKRRNLLICAVVAAVVLLVASRSPNPEPSYQGHPLSHWIHEYSSLYGPHFHAPPEPRQAATNAIAHIGTNALPFLLHWIDYKPDFLRHWLTRVQYKQNFRPGSFVSTGKSWIPNWVTTTRQFDRHMDAVTAFEVLGAAARPAIPQLSKLAHDPYIEISSGAFIALTYIGPEAVPELLRILGETNLTPQVRSEAEVAINNLALRLAQKRPPATHYSPLLPEILQSFTDTEQGVAAGGNYAPLLPQLLQNLTDTNQGIAAGAASVLGSLPVSPQLVVPALTGALRDPRPVVRQSATIGLAYLGANARPAVPDLLAALYDPSPNVRRGATNALRTVAPEALTNSPAH